MTLPPPWRETWKCTFYSCSNPSKNMTMYHRVFRDFDDGEMISAVGYDIVVRRRSMGKLALPTGKLVACDPREHPGTEPFDFELEAGTYPVRLYIAQLRDENRVAYAAIQVAPGPARRWSHATCFDEHQGYSVISSLGCFMDAQTATRLIEYTEISLYDEDEIDREMHAQFQRSRKRNLGYVSGNIEHEALGEGNLVVFSSGHGEGLYTTYVGYDESGQICRIVTDFEVLDLLFPTYMPPAPAFDKAL